MTRYVNLINGVEIPMTEAEITVRKNEEAEWDNNNTPFSLAMESLRMKRNSLLTETDYLALSDNTMSEAMTNYRQELRNITEGLTTVEDVEAVTFPTKP
jgi:chromosome segregation ATPase